MRQPLCFPFRAAVPVFLAVFTACPRPSPLDFQASIEGTPREGQTLTVSLGGWSPPEGGTLSYQWERCDAQGGACASVPGATGAELHLGAADVGSTLQARVSAKSGERTGEALAPHTSPIFPLAPTSRSQPTVSGEAQGGSTLTGSTGDWASSAPLTYTFQWLRCDSSGANCGAVSGATSGTHVLASADVGATLRLEVTATNAGGSAAARSAPTAQVVGVLLNTTRPALSGSAQISQALTGTQGTWQAVPEATYAFQWLRCDATGDGCTDIPGATEGSYPLAAEDLGSTVRLQVTASNTVGSSTARSDASAEISMPCANPISQGPRFPTAAVGAAGTVAWTRPSQALAEDGAAATATLRPGDVTEALVLTGWGFHLPPHAAIRGISVDVRHSATVAEAIMDRQVSLKLPGTDDTNNLIRKHWGTSPESVTYGGPDSRWGASALTAAMLNDPGFGVILSARYVGTGGPAEARVDSVRMTVYYTDASVVGPASPSLVQDDASTGTVAWSNPQAAATHDGVLATASNLAYLGTHYLKATGFGLALPAGKVPSGLYVEVERSGSVAGFEDTGVWRVKGGAVNGRLQPNSAWGTTMAYAGYGDALDAGGALTAQELEDAGFGVAVTVRHPASKPPNEVRVDHIRVSALYDPVDGEVSSVPTQAASTPLHRTWDSVDQVLADDGSEAIIPAMISYEVSEDLRTTGYGFSLPDGARITGIQLGIKRRSLSSVGLVDGRVRLMAGGQPGQADRGRPDVWTGGWSTVSYGGSADGWGRVWTPAEVNATGFGVALAVLYDSFSGNDHASVDSMALTVFYCAP